MDAIDVQYLVKFTRCPRCEAYSLREVQPGEADGSGEDSPANRCVCSNCGTHYVFQGNTLKEKKTWLPRQEAAPQIPVVTAAKKENKNLRRIAVFLIPLLIIAAAGILLLRSPGDKSPGAPSTLSREEKTTPADPSATGVTPGAGGIETPTGTPGTTETAGTSETPGTPGTGEEKTDEEPAAKEKSTETKTDSTPAGETPTETGPGVSADNTRVEPRSYKISESPGIRIRKSYPDRSDRSNRWYFSRATITIKRSPQQRVYLAGDRTGKRKWGVDDEVYINGERIKGLAQEGGELTGEGYIPDAKQLPPYEITHLVPANRKTVLDIRLTDYGIFWGNTSLYIVII